MKSSGDAEEVREWSWVECARKTPNSLNGANLGVLANLERREKATNFEGERRPCHRRRIYFGGLPGGGRKSGRLKSRIRATQSRPNKRGHAPVGGLVVDAYGVANAEERFGEPNPFPDGFELDFRLPDLRLRGQFVVRRYEIGVGPLYAFTTTR